MQIYTIYINNQAGEVINYCDKCTKGQTSITNLFCLTKKICLVDITLLCWVKMKR